MNFELTPNGPFSLTNETKYFDGWISPNGDPSSTAMAFPVEGWRTSAAVIVRQDGATIRGDVQHAAADAEKAWQMALAALSLDYDGAGWPDVGQRDPVLGQLQQRYQWLRPVLFHSPYEAAANFIIGHRISMAQARAIRQAMARQLGDKVSVGATELYAFPRPQVLAALASFPGVSDVKIQRLHGVAQAALDGLLDRDTLRSLPQAEALEKLQALDGVGPFFAQGILMRGAGLADAVTDEDTLKEAVQAAYRLPETPSNQALQKIAEAWQPFRMWSTVLLHVWIRGEKDRPGGFRHEKPAQRQRA